MCGSRYSVSQAGWNRSYLKFKLSLGLLTFSDFLLYICPYFASRPLPAGTDVTFFFSDMDTFKQVLMSSSAWYSYFAMSIHTFDQMPTCIDCWTKFKARPLNEWRYSTVLAGGSSIKTGQYILHNPARGPPSRPRSGYAAQP